MTDQASLHRSPEIEDLTHITPQDKKKIIEEAEKGNTCLHRSKETEDLAHLSAEDIKKPLVNQNNQNIQQQEQE